MRELKFRGKSVKTGEWVYGFYVGYSESSGYIYGDYIDKDEVFEVDAKTVGQFAGLIDKNGKEVYEGDVVRYQEDVKEYMATVSPYYGNNLYFVWENTFEVPTNTDVFGCKEELEIVGNIHENPELI